MSCYSLSQLPWLHNNMARRTSALTLMQILVISVAHVLLVTLIVKRKRLNAGLRQLTWGAVISDFIIA